VRVHALELSSEAALARHNLQRFADVTVQTTSFKAFRAALPFDAPASVNCTDALEASRHFSDV